MTVCIQYSRPSSGKGEGEIFGLDVAVNNFLTAYFRHGTPDKFFCRPNDMDSFDHFKALAKVNGVDELRCIGLDPRHPKQTLDGVSCLFRPDPLTADLIWRRHQLQGAGFSTCGLVHTMSGERIARAVGDLCIAPSDSADALICPSDAIRQAVQNLWQIYSEYLNHHFGSKYRCPVQTPVIPLGIDTNKFERLSTVDKRAAQRKALNVADDEIIILFVGRLSFATKSHPLALWQAAEKASKASNRKIRLIMFGYFKPADMEPHFRNLASETGKSVRIEFVMNDDARFPDGLWAAADIFTSLSDNIQESFGLTPIEAMACGLPTVITDWDGYRGGVRDGIDGFLVPTMTPPASAGMAIAEAYFNSENYGVSLMGASQSTSIDITRCAAAFQLLANNDEMRRRFSQSAKLRAKDTYDWSHIIKAYEALWRDLSEKRKAIPATSSVPKDWQAMHPAFPNPWQMFGSFPSRILTPLDTVQIVMNRSEVEALMNHEMNYFLPELLVDKNSMIELIEAIRRAGTPQLQSVISTFPTNQHDRIWRCIGWMLKHGICVLVNA